MRGLPIGLALGALLVGLLGVTGLLSLVWTPHDPAAIDVALRFRDPSADHPLGTDQLGRDMLSRLMAASVNTLVVAFLAVAAGGLIGVALGLMASALGGWAEALVMRACDLGFAFPAILLAVMLSTAFGPSLGNTILAIAFINVPVFARVTRGAANQIWARDFVTAARALGLSGAEITWRHILPNIAPLLIVQATIEFAVAILAEAALSYLGLGAQPPTPSWGRMLSEAQTLMFLAPDLAILPGLCIFLAVLGFGLLGDGLRDLTDPRLVRARVNA
ncbi:MAG: ABC transporter permease [Pseudomonadota bacterium]